MQQCLAISCPFIMFCYFKFIFSKLPAISGKFLATSGLFQGIPGYSRLMFRHFRQYPIISCYFHPVTFMSVYFPTIPIHLRPFVVIFRLFQAFPGNYTLFQAFPGNYTLFQAFPGYSRLFPDIPGHFNLYQYIQSIQPNSIFFTLAVALRLWSCAWERLLPLGVPGHLGTHSGLYNLFKNLYFPQN